MTTITLMLGTLAIVATVMLLLDRLEQRSRRREHQNLRRLHTYLAALPPSRPW